MSKHKPLVFQISNGSHLNLKFSTFCGLLGKYIRFKFKRVIYFLIIVTWTAIINYLRQEQAEEGKFLPTMTTQAIGAI
jgi:hypothetical protein